MTICAMELLTWHAAVAGQITAVYHSRGTHILITNKQLHNTICQDHNSRVLRYHHLPASVQGQCSYAAVHSLQILKHDTCRTTATSLRYMHTPWHHHIVDSFLTACSRGFFLYPTTCSSTSRPPL